MTLVATELRSRIASPETARRLASLAQGASPSTPLSLTVELSPGMDDWLPCLPEGGDFWYWAQPRQADWRLGLGTMLHVDSAGGERFAALDNAWAGLAGNWRRDGEAAAFFGFAFDPEQQTFLPNARLAIPTILLHNHGNRRLAVLSCIAGNHRDAAAHWQSLLATNAAAAPPALPRRHRQDLEAQAWRNRVAGALRAIAAGKLDKVVLTRDVRLSGEAPFVAAATLAALLAQQPECTIYGVGQGERIFLGASPERLIRLQGGRVEADALAGTTWLAPAGTPCAWHLDDDKNAQEQAFVVEAVYDALAGLCREVEVAAPETFRCKQVSHRRSRIAGRIRDGVSLFDLAAGLHPTPAVGGAPRAAALQWLHDHRESRHAWYTGGIGWIDTAGDGEITVALRCAAVAGSEVTLSAGAGIVAGSDPDQELAETEAKLQAMLEAFRQPAAPPVPAVNPRTGTR